MTKILIVAHDSGGAEIVSAWVRANPQYEYYFLLQGPALAVFSRKISELQNHLLEALPQLIAQVDLVLTGTSWNSDLERHAIVMAQSCGVFVISYLDHWVNYLERFLYQNIYCLPNEIWVGDEEAFQLAKKIFTTIPLRFIANQYFLDIQKEYKTINVTKKNNLINLLYICEPISAVALWKTGDANSQHYTEFTALQFFLERIHLNMAHHFNSIKFRLHPAEPKDKYDVLIAQYTQKKLVCPIEISTETSLLQDLAWADWVVGISSMALVIADLLNKKVFICAPPDAKVVSLPIKTIKPFDERLIKKYLTNLNDIESVV